MTSNETTRIHGACEKNCPGCCMTFSPDPEFCPAEVFEADGEE